MGLGGCVLFDLDGTLVDTLPDLHAAANHILSGLGKAPIDEMCVRDAVSGGGRSILSVALGCADDDPHMVETILPSFLSYYASHIACRSRVFDGVCESLDILLRRGFQLAICTNKSQYLAEALISALGMGDYFSAIAGGDRFVFRKPHPFHIGFLLDLLGGDESASVMVGDSAFDIRAAQRAGVSSIAVSFGYGCVDDLGSDKIADDFSVIPDLVSALV